MSNVPEYIKTVWQDAPSEETPLNAENLNKIENQVESLTNHIIEENLKIKLVYKGEVALLSNLPTTGQKVGDYYIVVEKGVPYVWNGDSFNPQVVIPEVNVSVDSIGDLISSADSKVTPNDSDTFGYSDAADIDNPNRLKKLSWANFKAVLKSYLDGFFAPKNNPTFSGEVIMGSQITSNGNVIAMGKNGGAINGYLANDSTGISLLDSTGTPKIKVNKATGEVDIMSRLNLTNGQVKFPDAQVPSADPNTLDDYEEGTFTPVIVGDGVAGVGTYIYQFGRYKKEGNTVNFVINIVTSAHTGTGNMIINGLPFTQASVQWLGTPCSIASAVLSYVNQLVAVVTASSVIPYTISNGGGEKKIPLDQTSYLTISGTYQAA